MHKFALSLDTVVTAAPGWYQGDFHCHTFHSDGTLSPPELARLARTEGMDFLAITDHNTLDAYAHFGTVDGLCVIPGLEVTFGRGHYNVFGVTHDAAWLEPVRHGPTQLDWAKDGQEVDALLAGSAADGLLNSINHPLLAPWAWLFDDIDLRRFHCLEIWNDPSWPDNRVGNPLALEMWTRWLNAGHRITGIGGSDFHRPVNQAGARKPPDRLGMPRTFVYAETLSGAAILDGLRRRQVYVSMGSEVSFQARHGDTLYPIGADLGLIAGAVELEAQISPAGRGGVARIVGNGDILAEQLLPWNPDPNAVYSLQHTARLAPDAPVWFRLEVLDGHGMLQAVTNPIFAGSQPLPSPTRFGDFVDVETLRIR